ncbi:MAG: hypothetical protein RL556_373 [Actinomycetota bacterium]
MTTVAKPFKIGDLLLPVLLPSALFATGEASLLPILPTAAQKLGADLPTAGLVAGLVMAGSLFFDVPAATFVNRVGERRAMIGASVLAAVAIASAAFATTLLTLSLAIFAAGSMAAIFGLARHGHVAEHVPFDRRGRALGMVGGSFRAGAFLGPMIGALAVFTLGMTSVYYIGAAFCLLATTALLFTKPDSHSRPSKADKISTFAVTKAEFEKLSTVGFAAAMLTAARSARAVGLPLWGVYIGMHEGLISLFIGIAAALDLALFYVSGSVIDKFGRRFAAVPSLLGMAAGMLLLIFAHNSTAFLLVAIFMSLANALGSGLVLTIGADLAPATGKNEFLAGYRMLLDVGTAGAPLAMAAITALAGLPAAFVFIAATSVLGAGIINKWLPRFNIR